MAQITEEAMQSFLETYETATISLLPLAIQIRKQFPVSDLDRENTEGVMLPRLLSVEQILHALATPPLKNAIQGSAINIRLLKRVQILKKDMTLQQMRIEVWRENLVKTKKKGKTQLDVDGAIERLDAAAKKIYSLQQTLENLHKDLNNILQTHQLMGTMQGEQWSGMETDYMEKLIEKLENSGLKIDKKTQNNLMKSPQTIDALVDRYQARNLPLPEELADV